MRKTEHCCEHCRLKTRTERLAAISASLHKVLNGEYSHIHPEGDTRLLWGMVRDLVDILREEDV